MVKEKNKIKNIENLQFAVYGGICGVIGLLSVLILFLSGFDCKSDNFIMIGISLICVFLGILTIFFGLKAKRHIQGKSIILLGIIVIILVGITYIFGIKCG